MCFIQVGDFADAKSRFESSLKLVGDDKATKRYSERTLDRIKEESTGNYDFDSMSKAASKHRRLDKASFISNVTVQGAG